MEQACWAGLLQPVTAPKTETGLWGRLRRTVPSFVARSCKKQTTQPLSTMSSQYIRWNLRFFACGMTSVGMVCKERLITGNIFEWYQKDRSEANNTPIMNRAWELAGN